MSAPPDHGLPPARNVPPMPPVAPARERVDHPPVDDAELLRRAVRGACRNRGRLARWWYVSRVFAIGSTSARDLCRRFGVDPWQEFPI